jgi:hypothetical protein
MDEVTNEVEVNEEVEVEQQAETEVEASEPAVVEGDSEANVEPEVPAYEPDWTYKAMGEERHFPEWVRGAVTSKEQEDELRSILAKAGGLEHFETKNKEYETRINDHYAPLEERFNQQNAALEQLNGYANKGDWKSFFEGMGVPNNVILDYAKSIFEYQDMTPEQRQQVDHQRQMQLHNEQLVGQNQAYESQVQNTAVQLRTMQLDMELNRPDVASFASKFDEVAGRPGAFKENVILRGQNVWNTQKVDLTPDVLVKQVMEMYPGFANQQTAPQATPTQATPTTQTVVKNNPPVIPNVKGGSQSPVKKQINSIADLKAARKKLESAQY